MSTIALVGIVPESSAGDDADATLAALAAENRQLRATLRALRTGLADGHAQLVESLQQLVSAVDAAGADEQQQQATLSSQRQISLYVNFLSRAVSIAEEVVASSSAPATETSSWRSKLFDLLRCRGCRVLPNREL